MRPLPFAILVMIPWILAFSFLWLLRFLIQSRISKLNGYGQEKRQEIKDGYAKDPAWQYGLLGLLAVLLIGINSVIFSNLTFDPLKSTVPYGCALLSLSILYLLAANFYRNLNRN